MVKKQRINLSELEALFGLDVDPATTATQCQQIVERAEQMSRKQSKSVKVFDNGGHLISVVSGPKYKFPKGF